MNRNEYRAAVQRLREAATAYYEDGSSALSDAEFDVLMREVAHVETANPSWVQGQPVSGQVAAGAVTGDVRHAVPMLSLDNIYSPDAVNDFTGRLTDRVRQRDAGEPVRFTVEPKLDGLAVSIRYRDGHPVQMVTRGDGLHGEDVTYALPCIQNLPHSTGSPFTGEVRGEIIFTRTQFERANRLREQHGDKPFANARNGAAGALRGAKERDYIISMSFYAYDVAEPQGVSTHTAAMQALSRTGFDVAAALVPGTERAEVPATIELIAELRDDLPVEIDGAVIKVDTYKHRAILGQAHRSPRWAIAYKYPPNEVVSTLVEVTWDVGRTGAVTPRARIEPVQVGGTTVTYATLHNPDDISRKGFLLGDAVVVVRAGDVIPRLDRPLPQRRTGSERPIPVPTACPRCGGRIDASGARLRCVRGRSCGVAESIAYAVSRDALDIEGLGPVQATNLAASGRVTSVADLFTLEALDLIEHGALAPGNAAKVLAQIERARTNATLARVITALGIRMTGRSMSRRLAAHFGSLEALQRASASDLEAVDGVGVERAATIRAELDELADTIDALRDLGVGACAPEQPRMQSGSTVVGLAVCVTGRMTGQLAGSRTQVQEIIEAAGARAVSSVSRGTDLLVVGENAGSKLATAQRLGVRVVTEEQFAAMIGSPPASGA